MTHAPSTPQPPVLQGPVAKSLVMAQQLRRTPQGFASPNDPASPRPPPSPALAARQTPSRHVPAPHVVPVAVRGFVVLVSTKVASPAPTQSISFSMPGL